MAAGLVVPISGPDIGLWGGSNALPPVGGNALGTQNDDGFVLSCSFQGQEVNASDAYGLTLVEAIYRGENWRLRFTGLEWNRTGLLNLMQMFGQVLAGTFAPLLKNIGDRWTSYCTSLQLTSILSSPAPSYPNTLTAFTAGLAPNSQTSGMWTSKLREMPLDMVLFPYQTTINGVSVVVPFVTA